MTWQRLCSKCNRPGHIRSRCGVKTPAPVVVSSSITRQRREQLARVSAGCCRRCDRRPVRYEYCQRHYDEQRIFNRKYSLRLRCSAQVSKIIRCGLCGAPHHNVRGHHWVAKGLVLSD